MSNATRKIKRATEDVTPPLPEIVDAADFWRLQAQVGELSRLREQLRAVQAEIRVLEPECVKATGTFNEKYRLLDGDQIETSTMKIVRKVTPVPPQPETTDDEPPASA